MRGGRLRAVLALSALVILPSLSTAQPAGTTAPALGAAVHNAPFLMGAVLRVVARSLGSEPIVGRVDSLRGEWVVLDTVAPRLNGGLFEANVVPVDQFRYVSLRAQDIRSVEVREGTSKTGGMIRYGLIGMGVGGLVGALSNGQAVNPTGNDFASGFVVGGIAGAVIGGTLGYLSGKDTWIKVPGPYYLNAPTP